MSEVRVGVFICDCGDRIAGRLDMERLAEGIQRWPDVALVQRLPYACLPAGLAAIRQAVAEKRLDRVVVAGCTARTLEPRLRQAAEQAGLERSFLDLVDIREGCAWVHSSEPEAALAKALDLVRMGVARVAVRQGLRPATAEVTPAALVIGGGLAGLTAALALGRDGVPVKLVERQPRLGGMLSEAHTLYPDRESAAELLAERIEAVTRRPEIEVLLESQVAAVDGSLGHYAVTIVSGRNGRQSSRVVEVGAIIVATGAECDRPYGLFRYDGQRVVTQLQFERELRGWEQARTQGSTAGEGSALPWPRRVVMLLCAGQRDGRVPYCSGVCCLAALKQAQEIKAADPQASVTILFRDLYLQDDPLYEEQVREVQGAGVEFLRYRLEQPPRIGEGQVEVYDELGGARRTVAYDRLVLATPLVPQADASVVAHLVGIRQDENGFFPEIRYRLRPQNCVERGIYVCGGAHGPTSWRDAEFQAASAAFSALRHLHQGRVESRAPVASVDEQLCTGCGHCVSTCSFGAISLLRREGVLSLSQIDPLLCKGCGNCVVACPSKAIGLSLDSDAEVLAQIEAALADRAGDGRLRIVSLGCEWSGYAASELAGANQLPYPPEVRLIRVGCSARFDPLHILWAFHAGADGVFLGACPPGECHYTNGNRYAQERIEGLQRMLAAGGFDARRLRLEWIKPDDPRDFVAKITAFSDLVRALGPSRL